MQKNYIVSMPVKRAETKLPGSTGGYFCENCNEEVLLSVSSQEKVDSHDYGVLCLPCGSAKAKADGQEMQMPSGRDMARDMGGSGSVH